MRLTDLAPEWISLSPTKMKRTQPGVGVSFHCPACLEDGHHHRIGVLFLNTLDSAPSVPAVDGLAYSGEEIEDYNNEGNRWARSGLTFEDLTLSPSLELDGHWHGVISCGEVSTSA